jgi:hypothetical protein
MKNWISIKGYENYEISLYGQVRNKKTGRILKTVMNKNSPIVNLYYAPGKFRQEIVSRLVLANFKNIESEFVVRHKDGNPANNSIDNLEAVSISEHNKKNYETGAKEKKISPEQIALIFKNYKKGCRINGSVALARKIGVSPTAILKMLKKKTD